MKHVLLLLTNDIQDQLQGLFLKQEGKVSLLDTNILFPLEWPKKDVKQVVQKLLWIATYGLVNVRDMEHSLEVQDLFGSENYKAVRVQVRNDIYQKIITDLESITKYMKYKQYHFRDFVSLALCNDMKSKQISIESVHCIRTFINK